MAPSSPKAETGARARRAEGHRPGRPRGVSRGGSKNNLGRASKPTRSSTGPPGPGRGVPWASAHGGFVTSPGFGAALVASG